MSQPWELFYGVAVYSDFLCITEKQKAVLELSSVVVVSCICIITGVEKKKKKKETVKKHRNL
jgi:hypothetical protein